MSESAFKLAGVRVTGRALRSARLNPPAGDAEDVILDGIDLALNLGAALSILGESGGGKSTLMRCLNRLIEVDSGDVEVLGKTVGDWDVSELRAKVVFVPQRSFLFGGSIRDELSRVLDWRGSTQTESDFSEILQALSLDVELDQDASELSEGQKHRLCIARALILKPKILMLDEPTGALDARTARDVLGAVKSWSEANNVTLVVVTHRPEDLRTLGGDAIILEGGKISCRVPASDIVSGKVSFDVAKHTCCQDHE
ncbi:MAG: ABC transporter ATP-binding protein [Planctomycetota bacterium]